MKDFRDICHQNTHRNVAGILMEGLKTSAAMGSRRTQRQHIHLLPFHPQTNLLKTGFKDANQRCAT
eukprot:2906204-Prorocentrum_lima.AAC.1